MTVVIRPEAINELLCSARWYDQRRAGLGNEFVDEAWAALERIRAMPTAFGRYELYRGTDEIRRAGLARFPDSVIFLVEPDGIVVLAFAPDRRRPLYWLDRLRHIGG
jgi:toxin ParE1/3/4